MPFKVWVWAAVLVAALGVLYVQFFSEESERKDARTVQKTLPQSHEKEFDEPVKNTALTPTREESEEEAQEVQAVSMPEEADVQTDNAIDEDEYEEDEQDEKEDAMAPVVPRDKLIGGADVEWEEPKEKSEKDGPFGLPPE